MTERKGAGERGVRRQGGGSEEAGRGVKTEEVGREKEERKKVLRQVQIKGGTGPRTRCDSGILKIRVIPACTLHNGVISVIGR